MIIIIEGADASGKTTLARRISDAYGYEYVHFGSPGPDPFMEYVEFLKELTRPVVCDRFFMGELIYGPMLRESPEPSSLDIATICRLLRRMGVCCIHVDTDVDTMRNRFKKKEHAVTWDQNVKAKYDFRQLFRDLPLGGYEWKLLYSSMPGELDTFLKGLRSVAQRQRFITTLTDGFQGIGTVTHRSLVLVGEAINAKTSRFGLPFDTSPCSRFLNESLHEAMIDENLVYLVNQDVMTQAEAYTHKSLGSYFVALGAKAQKKLKKMGIPYFPMEHPQFWLRFHNKNVKTYCNKLATANSNFLRGDHADYD